MFGSPVERNQSAFPRIKHCLPVNVGVLGEEGKRVHASLARFGADCLMQCLRQLQACVVRLLPTQIFKSAAGFIPA